MNDDTLESTIAKGSRAEELLRNALLQEAFATLEAEYIGFWKITAARDAEAREKLWLATQVVGKVRGHLAAVASNGKLAQRELDELAGGKRRRFGLI